MQYLITLLTSSISAAAAILVCVLNNRAQAARAREDQAKQMAIIELKIDTLSERVNKHNNLIERTYKLEEQTALQEEKIKVANHRIEDLERR